MGLTSCVDTVLTCPPMVETPQRFRRELGRAMFHLRGMRSMTPSEVVARSDLPLTEDAITRCESADGPTSLKTFVAICDGLQRSPHQVLQVIVPDAPDPPWRPSLMDTPFGEVAHGDLTVEDFVALCREYEVDLGRMLALMEPLVRSSLLRHDDSPT